MHPVALLLFAGLPASLAQLDAPLVGRASSPSSYARRAFTDSTSRRSSSLANRETAGVVFSETSNATVCGSLDIKWVYAINIIPTTTVINIEITNENVAQASPAPKTTSTSTTSTATSGSSTSTGSDSSSTSSASISSSINSGIFPSSSTTPFATPGATRGAFAARASSPVSLTIATNVPITGVTPGVSRDYVWNVVAVPVGWYVITGSSPDPSSPLVFFRSAQFYVADDGNSSCLQPGTIIGDHSSTSGVKPGIIAGAVVGSLLGIAAVLGLCVGCAFYRRRKSNTRSPQARPREWGQVGSHDSRPSTDSYARGPGALGRRAERHVGSVSALGHEADDSLEDVEKDGHEFVLPALNRSSTTSQAYPLTAMARATPSPATARATPSPLPMAPSPTPNGQAPNRRTPRKPVPTYEARQDDEETVVGSASTHTMLRKKSSEQLAGLANVNGSTGQVHYLIPDMPLPQRD